MKNTKIKITRKDYLKKEELKMYLTLIPLTLLCYIGLIVVLKIY